MKIRILILAILACCCFGFYFWYRSLRPSSETGGLLSMTLSGVVIDGSTSGFNVRGPMDVCVLKRSNGNCSLVAKKITIVEAITSVGPSRVVRTSLIVAVNPLQAYEIRLAELEGTLHLTPARFRDETNFLTWNDLLPGGSEPNAPRDP